MPPSPGTPGPGTPRERKSCRRGSPTVSNASSNTPSTRRSPCHEEAAPAAPEIATSRGGSRDTCGQPRGAVPAFRANPVSATRACAAQAHRVPVKNGDHVQWLPTSKTAPRTCTDHAMQPPREVQERPIMHWHVAMTQRCRWQSAGTAWGHRAASSQKQQRRLAGFGPHSAMLTD